MNNQPLRSSISHRIMLTVVLVLTHDPLIHNVLFVLKMHMAGVDLAAAAAAAAASVCPSFSCIVGIEAPYATTLPGDGVIIGI